MLSSAIAAIASFTVSIDFSAIALLKLAARASQSEAEAGADKNSVAENEIRNRLDTESILGFSIKLLERTIVSTKPRRRAGRRSQGRNTSILIRGKRQWRLKCALGGGCD